MNAGLLIELIELDARVVAASVTILMDTAASQLTRLLQGTVNVISEAELQSKLETGRPLRVKLGLDPTASDLHLGHAVVLRTLRRFQDEGHIAVLIVGDFTARVGDPTGKSTTRPQLTEAQVDVAAETYIQQVTQVLDPDPAKLEVRRNSEWLAQMGLAEILQLTSHATVSQMLARNDFSQRHQDGVPISITEFMYPLLQGWDSVMVTADVELGGTDQLFNLLMGRQLQKDERQVQQVVVTTPILVGLNGPDLDGPKMSKSLGNYVGISEPSNDQFGKIMSIPDLLINTYAQYATGWLQATIDEFVAERADQSLHPNAAKRRVAAAVCELYHGVGAGEAAEQEFNRVHKQHDRPAEIPVFQLLAEHGEALTIAKVLTLSGLATSNREATRLIGEGGVKLDGSTVQTDESVPRKDFQGRVLQVGRRRWVQLS